MADDMKLSLKKIRFDNKDGEFFMYSRYELGKKFHINLFNVKNSEAYYGDVSDINLRRMAATRRTPYSEFLSSTVSAIMWDDTTGVQFTYSLVEDAEDLYFRWTKIFEDEDMKVCLGRVKMSPVEFCSVIETVLCQVSAELHALGKSLEKTKLELEESNKEKERSKDLIQSAIRVKEDMEKELYSKFVLILNKKKEKIRKLKGQTVTFTPESATDDEVVNVEARKRTKKMPRKRPTKRVSAHVLSASEEEESESTEEDLASRPGPSTSNYHSHNSSLLLDDDELDIVCPVQQPRQRCPKGSRKRNAVCSQENEARDDSSSSVERNEKNRDIDDSIENLLDML